MAQPADNIDRLVVHDLQRFARVDLNRLATGRTNPLFDLSEFEQMFQSIDRMFEDAEPMVQSS